jgi:hypothetical protein
VGFWRAFCKLQYVCEDYPLIVSPVSWYMGADALRANGITKKFLYLIQDKALTSAREPLRKVRKSRIILFITIQLVGFGITFAITQTIGSCLFAFVF